jgi:hypothetical protein
MMTGESAPTDGIIMPDQRADRPEKPTDRYRCTFIYADDVAPPVVAGGVALRGWFPDRENADLCIEEGVARTDLCRITLEQRISDEASRAEWGMLHEWVRTGDGWRES